MKKHVLALGCGLITLASVLAGCTSNLKQIPAAAPPAQSSADSPPATQEQTAAETSAGTAGGETDSHILATGYAVRSTIDKSMEAGEEDGSAVVETMFAAVLVDSSGRIADCKIDSVQTKVNFSNEGKLLTDLDTIVESKNELGEKYGLKQASSIGKEWNQQAEGFAKYVIGKTVDEVTGIAVSADGTAKEADLYASVTIHIGDFIGVVGEAAANAKSSGAKAGDRLGYGIVTGISHSKDAAADADGTAQAYSTYIIASFDLNGKITSCMIDASQIDVNFDTEGKITSDLTSADFKTKNQSGDAYGLKKASAIGKEWNEQAANFAAYAVGKTAGEVAGLAIDEEEGAPVDIDLKAGVTIGIGDFQAGISKAAANEK